MVSHSLPPGISPDLAAGIRYLVHMGLWCMARLPLVSGAVGPAFGGIADNGEGADSHCAGLRSLGATVAQSLRAMPIRQPGSGNNAVFANLQGEPRMHMPRTLAFIEAQHAFHLQLQYIYTRANHLVVDLSRDNLPSFLSKVSAADRRPTSLPPSILTLLLDPM